MQRCSGQQYRSTLPVSITSQYYQQYYCHPMHSRLIFGPNAILCTLIIYSALRNVDFVSCDVTVVSSLKRFISRFLLPFVYLKEF